MTSTGKAAEPDVAYVDASQTLRQAGHLMRELGVGVLRVCGENGTVLGTISRDMVVRRIAAGGDPKTVTVGELAHGAPDGDGTTRKRPVGTARKRPGLVALPGTAAGIVIPWPLPPHDRAARAHAVA